MRGMWMAGLVAAPPKTAGNHDLGLAFVEFVVLPVVVLFVALNIFGDAGKKDIAKVITTVIGVLAGLFVVGIALVPGAIGDVSKGVYQTFTPW